MVRFQDDDTQTRSMRTPGAHVGEPLVDEQADAGPHHGARPALRALLVLLSWVVIALGGCWLVRQYIGADAPVVERR